MSCWTATSSYSSFAKQKTFLSYLNCFSGGIFLSMALVHMLPGTITSYERWGKKKGLEHLFPLPTVMMLAGYLLVLLLDRVIMVKLFNTTTKKNTQCNNRRLQKSKVRYQRGKKKLKQIKLVKVQIKYNL